MNDAAASQPTLELAEPKPDEGWSRARWLVVIALIFAVHIALIFLFGEKKETIPRAITNVPQMNFVDKASPLLALNDPTLFALPQQRDFAAAGCLKMPDIQPPSFRWTEPPRPLPLSANGLGAAFSQFIQTNFFASRPLNFKPAVKFTTPALLIEPALAQNSTMQVEGELAQRQLPSPINLTNWPYADVLAPCVVQALVDTAGNVVSTVILAPSGYDAADQRALELTRDLHFTPSSQLTVGRIIFNWHTVPVVPSTASP